MLAQRRPDEQVYVGPTSVSNVGPTESTTEKLRWPNVVMLSGWQMKFNVAKCHSMRVTRHPPDKHIQFNYTLHQQRLEQVQSARYL